MVSIRAPSRRRRAVPAVIVTPSSDPSGRRSRRRTGSAPAVIAVAVVVLLVGLLPLGRKVLDRRDQLLATNTRAPISTKASTLRPKARQCSDTRRDALLTLPAGTTAVRVYPTYDGPEAPPVTVELRGRGTVVRGTSRPGYVSGQPLLVRLDRKTPRALRRICIANEGGRTVLLARATEAGGNDREVPIDQGGPDRPARTSSTVRFDLIGRRDALAVGLVGRGLDHAAAYKPDGVGPVVLGAGLVLVLLLGAGAVVVVLRAPEDEEPVAAVTGRDAGRGPGGGGW
jgi:hypothetical protein